MVEYKILKKEDIEDVRRWRNSDLINGVSYNRTHITSDMQQKWYKKIENDISQRHWIITYNNENIGYAAIRNIDEKNRKCEFSSLYIGETKYLLSGTGAIAEYLIIDEIFNSFKVDKIFCEVLELNSKVIQLHKRFGFEVEGVLKNHYIIENKGESVHILSLFRDKWNQHKDKLKKLLQL